jgi:hypothetical protein
MGELYRTGKEIFAFAYSQRVALRTGVTATPRLCASGVDTAAFLRGAPPNGRAWPLGLEARISISVLNFAPRH